MTFQNSYTFLRWPQSFVVLGTPFLSSAIHSNSPLNLQAIVRGHKMGVDGSLTWLLDEFDTMSVTRSNSLRRGSPPIQPRRDSGSSGGGGGGQENGDPPHRHYSHPDRQDRSGIKVLLQLETWHIKIKSVSFSFFFFSCSMLHICYTITIL